MTRFGVSVPGAVDETTIWLLQRNEGQVLGLARSLGSLSVLNAQNGIDERALTDIGSAHEG